MYREVVRGSGALSPVWEGRYKISVSGELFVPLVQEMTVGREARLRLEPTLEYTREYVEGGLKDRLRAYASKAGSLSRSDLGGLEALGADIRGSGHGLADLAREADGLLAQARVAVLDRELSAEEKAIESARAVNAEDVLRLLSLKDEAQSLGEPGEVLAARLDRAVLKARELERNAASQGRLADLQGARDRIVTKLRAVQRTRRGLSVAGRISAGLGLATGGLSGLFWYLSDQAYARYRDTSVSAESVRYRAEVERWNTLTWVSWGTGGAGIGTGFPLWVARPSTAKQTAELARVESAIRGLTEGGK
jgi:hypothetical protein